MAQAEQYISYILSHQNADGWLGPVSSGGDQYWGPSNVLQTLWQWAEAKKPTDEAAFINASQAVLLHLLEQHKRMQTAPLASWAQARPDSNGAAPWSCGTPRPPLLCTDVFRYQTIYLLPPPYTPGPSLNPDTRLNTNPKPSGPSHV